MPSDQEKAEFKSAMMDFFKRTKVGVRDSVDKPANDSMIVLCVRAKDFREEDNDYWELEGNKSKPRDIECGQCHEKVAMSNEMFRMYGEALTKPEVRCQVCMMDFLEKEKSDGNRDI